MKCYSSSEDVHSSSDYNIDEDDTKGCGEVDEVVHDILLSDEGSVMRIKLSLLWPLIKGVILTLSLFLLQEEILSM